MELQSEPFREHICPAAAAKPEQAAFDIGLLELVELLTRRDVPEFQAIHLVGIERRRAFRLVGDCDHILSQKSAGLVRSTPPSPRSTPAPVFFSRTTRRPNPRWRPRPRPKALSLPRAT